MYDETGEIKRAPEDEFADAFCGGTFRDATRRPATALARDLSEQLAVREQEREAPSHAAGFEAWMRSRGTGGVQVFTAEDVADRYGVAKGSYEPVSLPRSLRCFTAVAKRPLGSAPVVEARALPPEGLLWGQVLVSVRAAPVTMGDLYTIATGGAYGDERAADAQLESERRGSAVNEDDEPRARLSSSSLPFVAGHDMIGVVEVVGPGVTALSQGDYVIPGRSFLGTWRTLLVAKAKDLVPIPRELMSFEHLALLREMTTAYRLLEEEPGLKPGDCIVLNAATGAVGQFLIQIASLLRLRVVAVASVPQGDADDSSRSRGRTRGRSSSEPVPETAPAQSAQATDKGPLPDVAPLKAKTRDAEAGPDGTLADPSAREVSPRIGAAYFAPGEANENADAAPNGTGAAPTKPTIPAATTLQSPEHQWSSSPEWQRTEAWLRSLGATVVLPDAGSLRLSLERMRFFSKPKLGLDGVGGPSSGRLADALEDGGALAIFGCASGRAPAIPWQAYVFRNIRVRGFNARTWREKHPEAWSRALEQLGKLERANKIKAEITEYDLATELDEAIEHARERGRHTRIVLRVSDVGTTEA